MPTRSSSQSQRLFSSRRHSASYAASRWADGPPACAYAGYTCPGAYAGWYGRSQLRNNSSVTMASMTFVFQSAPSWLTTGPNGPRGHSSAPQFCVCASGGPLSAPTPGAGLPVDCAIVSAISFLRRLARPLRPRVAGGPLAVMAARMEPTSSLT